MNKIRILTVFGTRPEASKMAPVVIKMRDCADTGLIDSKVCVTAQHRGMLDDMLAAYGIKADYDLNIMRERQSLSDVTVNALRGLEKVFAEAAPDLVLVHGDTTTTLTAALGAFYAKIKVGHVEAGLRTYDKYQPYPEEMNRKMVTALADLNFAPTGLAKENLIREGVSEGSIFVTGNTAIDSLKYTVRGTGYIFECKELNSVDFSKRVITMTAHRRENLGAPHESAFGGLRRLIDDNPDCVLVYPVHPNPLVQETAQKFLGGHERIILTSALGVSDMHNLMSRSYLVVTDSGGLQEEAPALRKPVVVLRNVTERPEGLAAGTLKLAGTDGEAVYRITSEILHDKALYASMASAKNPFGDGEASGRIVEAILYHFGRGFRPSDFE